MSEKTPKGTSGDEVREPGTEAAGLSRRDVLALGAGAALTLSLGSLGACETAPVGPDGGAEGNESGGEVLAQDKAEQRAEASPADEPASPDESGVIDAKSESPSAEPDAGGAVDEATPEPQRDTAGPELRDGTSEPPEGIFETPGTEGPIVEGGPEQGPPVAFAPKNTPHDKKLFPYGVQAGSMRANSLIVWTFSDDTKTKQLKIWRPGPTAGTVYMAVDTTVTPNKDGYLKVPVMGLQAGQWYSYAFFNGTLGRSTIGKFRTAFGPGVLAPLTIGATCCTKTTYAPYKSLQLTAKEPIDMIVQLGDMSYNDKAKDLAGYRKLWRETLQTGGYAELLPQAGMYNTWDDHEIDNNYDPTTFDMKRIKAAKDAFFETLPVERGPNDRVWTSYRWGDTAEIFLLDCRSERKPSTRKNKDATYIGKAQMQWLKTSLAASTAHFKILLNTVPITNMPTLWLSSSDRWEGYAAQRKELLDFLAAKKLKNIWFLSGDLHTSFVSKLEKSGPASSYNEIACGPGGAFPNPLGAVLRGSQFPFGKSMRSAMTLLTFDPKANEVRIKIVNANGGKVEFDKKLKQV